MASTLSGVPAASLRGSIVVGLGACTQPGQDATPPSRIGSQVHDLRSAGTTDVAVPDQGQREVILWTGPLPQRVASVESC